MGGKRRIGLDVEGKGMKGQGNGRAREWSGKGMGGPPPDSHSFAIYLDGSPKSRVQDGRVTDV